MLTTGFDARVVSSRFEDGNQRLTARLELHGEPGREAVVLCGMGDSGNYRATVNGSAVPVRRLASGALEIRIAGGPGVRELRVSR